MNRTRPNSEPRKPNEAEAFKANEEAVEGTVTEPIEKRVNKAKGADTTAKRAKPQQ